MASIQYVLICGGQMMKPWLYFSKKCLVFIHCKGVVNILTLLLRRPFDLSSFDSVLFIFLFEQEKNQGMPLLFLVKTMVIENWIQARQNEYWISVVFAHIP